GTWAARRVLSVGDGKTGSAAAGDGERRGGGVQALGGQGKSERAADRASHAVDEPAAHRQHALAPLGELTAVANQNRVVAALDVGAQRAEHLGRMQTAGRLCADAAPSRGTIVESSADFAEPM